MGNKFTRALAHSGGPDNIFRQLNAMGFVVVVAA